MDFSEGAAPPDLPGGNPIGFNADFSADSDPPPPANGVNNSGTESLTIVFDLTGGATFADLLNAVTPGQPPIIGLHIQGLPQGESDSYVNRPIPEPATLLLMGAGLLGGGLRARRSLSSARQASSNHD